MPRIEKRARRTLVVWALVSAALAVASFFFGAAAMPAP